VNFEDVPDKFSVKKICSSCSVCIMCFMCGPVFFSVMLFPLLLCVALLHVLLLHRKDRRVHLKQAQLMSELHDGYIDIF
jgi:hypothetical protein